MIWLLVLLAYVISWIATVGLIKLVTICFGLTFSWLIATGVWLALLILRAFIK